MNVNPLLLQQVAFQSFRRRKYLMIKGFASFKGRDRAAEGVIDARLEINLLGFL
jgi:hypothetical protein